MFVLHMPSSPCCQARTFRRLHGTPCCVAAGSALCVMCYSLAGLCVTAIIRQQDEKVCMKVSLLAKVKHGAMLCGASEDRAALCMTGGVHPSPGHASHCPVGGPPECPTTA